MLSLVAPLAKGQFYFRPEDLHAQQEFLSYPRGKHDDILDAIYYAMDGAKPTRRKEFQAQGIEKKRKILDWMTM